jgi:hypothetical protein
MAKRAAFLIDLGDDEEARLLMENLDNYIRLTGWSRKRFYLMGAASIIGQSGENDNLVMQIADYLTKGKSNG